MATLFEDRGLDKEEEGGTERLRCEDPSPAAYELAEYGDDDEVTQHHRELVSARGETMVEALLQLELAYRNLLGA